MVIYNPCEHVLDAIRSIFLDGWIDSTMNAIWTSLFLIFVLSSITGFAKISNYDVAVQDREEQP